MTPQLQQAIRLLQLSSMELSLEVQQALESNMMLELEDESRDPYEAALDVPAAPSGGGDDADGAYEGADTDADFDDVENYSVSAVEDIPQDLPVDSEWEDIFDSTLPQGAPAGSSEDGENGYERASAVAETLREHLLWQINLLPMSALDREIALAIVDALNDDGYLESTLEEILAVVTNNESDPVLLEEIQAVLHQIQALDPAGVGARDLKECLQVQLKQLPRATPKLAEAQRLCDEHLAALANREYTLLMRRLRLSNDELRQVIALIQSLNPRPGATYSPDRTEYLVPDVFVRKVNNRWKVELNAEAVPQLRINPYYASMIRRAENTADNNSLRTHLQEAKWFIKSLQSRSETLLRVATAIVERQKAFLEHGDEAMKPLVLHDIAETLSLHESTISRVTTRKYMYTPRGTYELKYFFSSHVGTSLGGEASSTAIRAVIRKLIAAENSSKPLSDSKLATILIQQGINVARRTVAKYREGMNIRPSNERKQLA